ncbi:ZDHC4 palmitoyltransferase, partial [Chloroceryle aenea]|nr:ZDHC4 palmitoyltransferase [Chloroceryle aenea]
MDFLTLFLIYLCFLLAAIALLCLCSGRKESFLARSVSAASQVLSLVIPAQLQRVAHRTLHRLFHTRSCLFVVLHVALQAAVYGEYSWEVCAYCWELHFPLLLLLLPFLLLLGNLGCFLLCSRADPGVVTESNHAALVRVYAYDGVLFQKGTRCPTCDTEKPARSKHCSVCSGCVHRFDHHCVPVIPVCEGISSQCFIFSSSWTTDGSASASCKGILARECLLVFRVLRWSHASCDFNAPAFQPSYSLLPLQHLFLTFPRIVFMLGFVTLLTLVLGGYCCFNLYLALTNQTSNEWYKARRYRCSHQRQVGYKNIYSKGIWMNLKEIFQPPTVLERKKK